VVADELKEGGGEEQTREVRAHLCNGESINKWFWGQASGNDLDLASEGGARLEGGLTAEAATGTHAPRGRRRRRPKLPFEAPLAEGVDGFYTVSVPAEGPLSAASSWRKARLEGERTGERITGTLTPPEIGGGSLLIS